MKIKKFENFLNTIYQDLKSLVFKSDTKKNLKEYKLEYRKITDTYYKFTYKDNIVGELKLDGEQYNRPSWKLIVYFYESEIKNVNNETTPIPNIFEGQDEIPYGKGSKKFTNITNAVEFLIGWWSTKTNSGRGINKDYKIKF